MIPNVGPVELIFVLLPACVLLIWPAWRICSRAGFPGALGLLIAVPVFNLVLLYVLAFADWPALGARKKSTNLDI